MLSVRENIGSSTRNLLHCECKDESYPLDNLKPKTCAKILQRKELNFQQTFLSQPPGNPLAVYKHDK